MVYMIGVIEIEVYDTKKDKWAQAKFLVHGYDDILWTDDPDAAAQYAKESIIKMFESR